MISEVVLTYPHAPHSAKLAHLASELTCLAANALQTAYTVCHVLKGAREAVPSQNTG